MDEDRATIIVATAILAARELSALSPLIGKDDHELKIKVASAVYEVSDIAAKLMDQFPQLKHSIESRLEKYGRAY